MSQSNYGMQPLKFRYLAQRCMLVGRAPAQFSSSAQPRTVQCTYTVDIGGLIVPSKDPIKINIYIRCGIDRIP